MLSKQPVFSIVVPAYNRRDEIRRCIDSCLRQTFSAFEVIVVDDGSTDGTPETAEEVHDLRLRVIRLPANRGVCPARNAGVAEARGEWIVFLDSDDELLPNALDTIAAAAALVPPQIGRLALMFEVGPNAFSPDPAPEGEDLDYLRYIQWAQTLRVTDFLNCIRRTTFQVVRLPENRSYEGLYHLDFASRFQTRFVPVPAGRVHRDARNHISRLKHGELVARFLRDAPDSAETTEVILARHGEALRELAPRQYRRLLRNAIRFSFLSGERRVGLRRTWRYMEHYPTGLDGTIMALCGLVGPRFLGNIQAWRRG